MAEVIWVASTRPSVGKTRVAVGLLHALRRAGRHPVGVKPIELAAGYGEDHDLTSPDADRLGAAAGISVPPLVRAPYRFAAHCAPLIATRQRGIELTVEDLAATIEAAASFGSPVVVDSPSAALAELVEGGCGLDVAERVGAVLLLVAPEADHVEAQKILEAATARGLRSCGAVPFPLGEPEAASWDPIAQAVLDALAG